MSNNTFVFQTFKKNRTLHASAVILEKIAETSPWCACERRHVYSTASSATHGERYTCRGLLSCYIDRKVFVCIQNCFSFILYGFHVTNCRPRARSVGKWWRDACIDLGPLASDPGQGCSPCLLRL